MARTHRFRQLELLALVAIGGFGGASLRFGVGSLVTGVTGTLVVNAVGSLALGFLLAVAAGRLTERVQTVLSTGFLASFTTYSTFAVETFSAAGPLLVGNVAATYALGFAGVLLGRWLARRHDADATVGVSAR